MESQKKEMFRKSLQNIMERIIYILNIYVHNCDAIKFQIFNVDKIHCEKESFSSCSINVSITICLWIFFWLACSPLYKPGGLSMEAQEYSLPSDTDKNLHNSAPISVRYYQFFEKKNRFVSSLLFCEAKTLPQYIIDISFFQHESARAAAQSMNLQSHF